MKIERISYVTNLAKFLLNYGVIIGVDNNQRIKLTILLCNITQQLRKKDPKVLVIDLLEKIIKDNDVGAGLEEFLVKVSFQCEALLAGDQEQFPDYGLTETKEKIDKIREIVNNFLTF